MQRIAVAQGPLTLLAGLLFCTALAPADAQDSPTPAPAPAAATPAPAPAPAPGALNAKEQALLEKINALKAPRWRAYGACRYDWSAWKLMPDGVRTTAVQCGTPAGTSTPSSATQPAAAGDSVAVHCDTLKLSIRNRDQAWSGWRLPYSAAESAARGGEDRMVATLCANAKPVPTPQPSVPPAATAPAQKSPSSQR